MLGLPKNYCGDERMGEYLRGISSPLTIHHVYGLLYGCLTAPNLVPPSQYMPFILGEKGAEFKSEEQANELIGNLMALWNELVSWDAEEGPAKLPALEEPKTNYELKTYIEHRGKLIIYFCKGLDRGGTDEPDFTPDGLQALEDITRTQAIVEVHLKLMTKKPYSDEEIRTAYKGICDMEPIISDCISRINIGLKAARMRQMQKGQQGEAPPLQSQKTGRNEPCPCGSGKKYKICCGIQH